MGGREGGQCQHKEKEEKKEEEEEKEEEKEEKREKEKEEEKEEKREKEKEEERDGNEASTCAPMKVKPPCEDRIAVSHISGAGCRTGHAFQTPCAHFWTAVPHALPHGRRRARLLLPRLSTLPGRKAKRRKGKKEKGGSHKHTFPRISEQHRVNTPPARVNG